MSGINFPQGPITNPETGGLSLEWFMFLQDMTKGFNYLSQAVQAQAGFASTMLNTDDSDTPDSLMAMIPGPQGARGAQGLFIPGMDGADGDDTAAMSPPGVGNLMGPITSAGNVTSIASQTGTGSKFVMDTTPTLVTPVLGVATATSINKLTLTQPATGATLTIPNGVTLNAGPGGTLGTAAFTASTAYDAAGVATSAVSTHAALQTGVHGLSITAAKTLSVGNSLTLTATDGSTLAIGTGGTLGSAAYTASGAYLPSGGTAANATNATNTAITDDTSTVATMYPTWVTTSSGNQAQKTSSTKLTFNPSTGVLTATGFAGALAGNVTGNVSGSAGSATGNAATATKLAATKNINGVAFDGSADITVTAAAGTLSGATLNAGVTASSLTSFGASPTLTTPNIGAATGTSLNVSTGALTSGAVDSSGSARFTGYTARASGVGIEVQYNQALDGKGRVRAYDRDGAVYKDLILNDSVTISASGPSGTIGTAAFTAASAYDVAGAAAAVTPTSLGLVIGTNVQAYNSNLTAINQALTTTSSPSFTAVTAALTGNASTATSAAKWTSARNLAGNSVDGSVAVAFANKFIVQGTTDAGLSGPQFLGALGTGIVKNTTTTGVLSIAIAGDFPTLNQSTTGSAATLTTARSIYGANFDGSAALSGIIASTYGGTGNGWTKFSGPTLAEKTFTLPDASATLLYAGGALGTPSAGTLTNATGLPIAGITMNTARMLGRTTAASGAAEEITIGSGLSLSAGTLSSTAGGGSVTSASVVSANGFSGTVATASSTPAITLTTSVTGIVKGNGTAISAAIAGDFPTLNQSTTGSAATLTTPRAINGVNFDGSAAITVTAAAGTLSGNTLNSTVTASSLTSLGTVTALNAGTISASGNTTIGVGGTGAVSPVLNINGSSAVIQGPVLTLSRNSVTKAAIGTASWWEGGVSTSDDLAIGSESGAVKVYASNSTTPTTVTSSTGLAVATAFGCNGATPQTKQVSGGTVGGVITALINCGILSS